MQNSIRVARPPVKLVGIDSNVYNIIAACKEAARRAGWTAAEVQELTRSMMHADDYQHVLRIAQERFEVS